MFERGDVAMVLVWFIDERDGKALVQLPTTSPKPALTSNDTAWRATTDQPSRYVTSRRPGPRPKIAISKL